MSLGRDMGREKQLSEDILARHEERNNLYTYLGQGFGFEPFVSGKIKLENGDILAMYTRGIWEHLDSGELHDVFSEAKDNPLECLDNIEDLLLSRQPEELENYTFAAVFINKIFLDPNRKRRIKKIITITVVILAVIAVISLALWIFNRMRQKQIEEMNRRYLNTIEYIQDNNYLRAGEECSEALKAAEKLRDKKRIAEISDYQKLIEAVNAADESYSGAKYEEAQTNYVTAKERSRYADHLADEYIERQLDYITNYLSVFDYIQLGDTLTAGGDYERAEEKYLAARSLATRTYFEAGRKDAIESLETMYTVRNKAEESDTQEAKAKASNETGAAGLASEGDKAFAEGDYAGASAYYAMALEKYQELGDTAHAELLTTKISSSGQKSEANLQKEQQAETYVLAGKEQEAFGDKLEAKKQYLFAKNLFKELKKDDRVTEMDGLIEILETSLDKDKADKESIAAEKESLAAEKESVEAESRSMEVENQSMTAQTNNKQTKKTDALGPGQEDTD